MRSRGGIIFRGTDRPMAPMQLWVHAVVASLFLILAVLPQSQAALPTAADCPSLSASGTNLLAGVDGINLFDGNQQLTQPLVYENGASVIVSGGARMVELDASQLTQPVIQVRGASTVCLHNLRITGSTVTVISASGASSILLNAVNITESSLTSPGSLIEMDGSSLQVFNSAITDNILRNGRYSLINITADSSNSSVSSSLIADNTLSSACTLITVHFPAVAVTSFSMSGKTVISNNTVGRLLHATAAVPRASTLMGLNSRMAAGASILSNTNLLAIFSGTADTTETASSLMGYIAARAASVMLQDTVFIGNQVVLELMALYAVHTQLHSVEFMSNRGVGIPVMGVRPASNEKCCVELMNSLSSFPNFMPASWRGAIFNNNTWNDSLECTTKQPVILVTASRQPLSAQAVAGSNPRALDCGVPTGSRVASHLLYSFNGTVWMTNTTMRSNNFTYGSLMEASNHTSVILQDSVIEDNTAQTMLNCSSTTLYLNKKSYQKARLEDEWRRDLTVLTDADSFAENDNILTDITERLMMEMQLGSMCIQGSNFTNNTFYSAVLRSWGTRSGKPNDSTTYSEESVTWYIKSVLLSHNKLEDIGQPRQNSGGQWTTPSIISFIHVNATIDDVTISNNSAVMIVNIETSSTTILNSRIQNNTLSLNDAAPVAAVWYTKWSTLGFQNTTFEGNCPGASNTSLILLDSVHTYIFESNFTSNILAPTSSSLVYCLTNTQLSIQQCTFARNQAEKLFYAIQTRHVLTTDTSFINNTGTCMHLDYPKRVYESQFHRTNLTRLTFKGNVGAAHGSLYVTLGLLEGLAVYNQSVFAENQGEKGALVFEQEQPTAANMCKWTISESKFLRNTAAQHGGAIAVIGGTLNMTDTAIVNNIALGTGGGIYADVSQYQLANAVVTGNKAQSAAGLALITQRGLEGGAGGAPILSRLENCTIANNYIDLGSRELIAPAVLNCGLGGGGGLCLVSPAANLSQFVNTRIVNNTARYGGAIFIDCGLRSTDSDCRTDITLMQPYGIISQNTASTPASSVAMLSSRQVMRVKCSNQSDFRSLAELVKEMPLKECGGWQLVENNAGAASTLGIGTGPKEVRFSVNGSQLQYNPEGSSKVVSGTAWDATVTLLDEDGHVVVDMLDDMMLRLSAQEKDLVMVSGDHLGEVNISFSSINTTEGKFLLTNIITWPSQSDPNNKLYTLHFAAETPHSKFPIAPKDLKLILSRCTLGEYLLSSTHACQACHSLNSIKPLFSLRPDIRCEPCPENGACSHGHGMLLPEPHFFQPSFLLPQIIRCPIPEACLQSRSLEKEIISWKEELGSMEGNSSDVFDRWLQSGNGTVNGSSYSQKNKLFMKLQCSPGYQGFLCGACAKHYGRYFGRCQRCLPVWANTILLLMVIAGMLGVVALLTSGHIRKTLRKYGATGMPGITFTATIHKRTREPHMKRPATQSFLPSCLKWLDIMPDLSPQAFEKVSHIFKVLTTFVQVNSIMRGVQWLAPRPVRQFFSQVDFTSSPSAWVSMDCSLQRLGLDSEQLAVARSVFMILLPAFCILIAYSTWMLLFVWNVKKKRLPRQSWKEFIVARFWLSTVQICYILYPVVTINIFDVFKCDPLSGAADDMERSYWEKYKLLASSCNGTTTSCNVPLWQSKWLWTQHHETECGTGRHAALMWSLGLLSLIFFAVGVPVGLVALLLTHRQQLNEPKTELKFGFLYEEYKEQFSFWESVIMARKVALLVIIIALPYIRSTYRQYIQVSSSILVMMVCLLLHLTYQPFTDKLLNRLETVSIVMTVTNMYMLTYWMIPDMSETIKLLVMVVLLFLNTLVIAYFLFELVYQFKHEAKAVADHACGPHGCCSCLKGCRKQPDVDNHRCANMNDAQLVHHDVEQNDLAADDRSNADENGMNDVAGATVYRYGMQDTQLWRDTNHHLSRMALVDNSGSHSETSVGRQGGSHCGVNCNEEGEYITCGGANAMGGQLRFEVPQPPSSRRSTCSSVSFPCPMYSNVGVGVGTQPTGLHTGPIITTAGGVQLPSSFMHDVIQCPRLQPVQPAAHVPPASHDSHVRSSSQQQPFEIWAPWAPASGGDRGDERWVAERWSDKGPQDNDHGSAGDDWRRQL